MGVVSKIDPRSPRPAAVQSPAPLTVNPFGASGAAPGPQAQPEVWRRGPAHVSYDHGVMVGNPTGGNMGDGTVNAENLFIHGVPIGSGSSGGVAPPTPVPPVSPVPGTLWFDPATLQLYVWFDDGNSAQWVVAINDGGGGGSAASPATPPAPTTPTPPASPRSGDLWFDSVGAQLYIRFDDGNSAQWVAASNQSASTTLLTGLAARVERLERRIA